MSLDFLSGGGEMGERIRAFDWSSTPLGPPVRWPQALKTALRIMLTSRQPIWIGWGPELTYFYNDPYKAIIGGKHPAALGQPTRVVWKEIWDIIGPMLATALKGVEGTYVEEQLLIMHRHGYAEETYYTYSYTPVPDDQGGTGGIICANTDDTQRVIGQRQLGLLRELSTATASAKSDREVCEAAARVFDEHARDVSFALVYLVEPNDDEARLSAHAGIAVGEPIVPERVKLRGKDALAQSFWPFQQALAGEPVTLRKLRERTSLPGGAWPEPTNDAMLLPLKGSQGSPFGFVILGATPRRPFDDKCQGFFELIASNVTSATTNARAYEEQLQRSEQLAELDRAKTAFFSNVSHEFRTPLTLMLGPVEDLLSRSHTDLTPATKNQLELVNRNGVRLLRLVNTLLDFSRIEAGRMQACYVPTDLAAFTSELASVFRAATDRAGLKLIVECPRLPEAAFVDRDMWEKIVLNLLSNAFKFTFEGHIKIALEHRDNHAELRISDTGVGIPAEGMSRLFERFHRVTSTRSRTHEGSGIGLALVQELVKLHGGNVRAESAVGQGTTFIVSIPLGSSHLPADRVGERRVPGSTAMGAAPFVEEALRWLPGDPVQHDPHAEQVATVQLVPVVCPDGTNGDNRPRVIVADDNADMRQYVARLLSERYCVEAVGDGEAVLAAARKNRPDLILSDVMMPNLDGFGLVKRLRADEALRTVPIILLSARAGEESRVEGLDVGADDYLIKPFSARELMARVESHLKLARVREESEQQLQLISDSVPALISYLDPEFRYQMCNRAYTEWFGLSRDEVLGKRIWEVLGEEAWQTLKPKLDTAMGGVRVEFETEAKYKHGGTRWIHAVYTPHRGAHGRVEGVVILVTDITARRRGEEMIAQAKDDLERANKDLERRVQERTAKLRETIAELESYSYSISHDMRAPLRAMHAYAQVLVDELGPTLDESSRRYLDRITAAATRLDKLITDVLSYSRISRADIDLRPINLDRLVEDITHTYPALQHVSITTSGPLGLVLAAEALLTQAIANILTNAAKFVAKGVTPEIRIWSEEGRPAEDARPMLRVCFQDNGIGIAPRDQERIFGIFARVHSEKEYEGTGIGLSVVKRAIEKMGGVVGVQSEVGKGSTFWIELQTV